MDALDKRQAYFDNLDPLLTGLLGSADRLFQFERPSKKKRLKIHEYAVDYVYPTDFADNFVGTMKRMVGEVRDILNHSSTKPFVEDASNGNLVKRIQVNIFLRTTYIHRPSDYTLICLVFFDTVCRASKIVFLFYMLSSSLSIVRPSIFHLIRSLSVPRASRGVRRGSRSTALCLELL